MRFLIFIFAIFSFNSFAGYLSKTEFESCSGPRSIFTKKSACELAKGESCFKIPDGYNCEYHRVTAAMEDDLNSPKYTKSEVESCVDETECDSIHAAKICTDPEESAIKRYDTLEVYCSKQNGWNQMSVTKPREDASLKSAYESAKAVKDAEKAALKAKLADMEFGKTLYAGVRVMNDAKGLSKGQKRQLRANLGEIRDDLFDGSICSAREDIAALTPDGTLITSGDVTAVLAKIDAYKSCP